MRLTGLPEHLRERGLTVVTHGDWASRGSASFDPKGVVCHHTGPWSTVPAMVELCIRGRRDLPGPLCHAVLAPDGVFHVIAGGRANHAGPGGWKGLSGNSSVVGVEAMHSGAAGAVWPALQRRAYSQGVAAICELLKVNEAMVCGHKEWAPGRKVDPAGIDMARFRAEVAVWLTEWRRPAPPMEVPPMFNPPIEIIGKVVATLKAPSGGVWMLTGTGHIYAWEGAPDKDMPARHPDYWGNRKAARLEPLGAGYRVVASSGEFYEYP